MRMLPVYTYRQGASALGYMSRSKTTHLSFETPRSPSPPPPPFCFLFLSCLVMLHSGLVHRRCALLHHWNWNAVRPPNSVPPFDEFTHRRQSSLKSFPENQILSSTRTAYASVSRTTAHERVPSLCLLSSVSFKIYALSRSPGIRLRWRSLPASRGNASDEATFPSPSR